MLLAAWLLVLGCGEPRKPPSNVKVSTRDWPAVILVDDQPVGTTTPQTPLQFPLKGRFSADRFSARMLLADGETAMTVTEQKTVRDEREILYSLEVQHESWTAAFGAEHVRQAFVFLDNRGGVAGELKIGKFAHPVTADSKEKVVIPLPRRTEPLLLLNSEELGRVEENGSYLADPTGKRRYQGREVGYATPNAVGSVLLEQKAPVRNYRGERFHELKWPASSVFFLEKATKEVFLNSDKRFGATAVYLELTDEP
jgi:hypothetical protein